MRPIWCCRTFQQSVERPSSLDSTIIRRIRINGTSVCKARMRLCSSHGRRDGSSMSNDLNSFLFSTPEMTRVFSQQGQLRAMMRFEWALTCALEKHGLAETGSSQVLESLLDADFVDDVLL